MRLLGFQALVNCWCPNSQNFSCCQATPTWTCCAHTNLLHPLFEELHLYVEFFHGFLQGSHKMAGCVALYCVHTYVHTAINRLCAEVDIWFVG